MLSAAPLAISVRRLSNLHDIRIILLVLSSTAAPLQWQHAFIRGLPQSAIRIVARVTNVEGYSFNQVGTLSARTTWERSVGEPDRIARTDQLKVLVPLSPFLSKVDLQFSTSQLSSLERVDAGTTEDKRI